MGNFIIGSIFGFILPIVGVFCGFALSIGETGLLLWIFALGGDILALFFVVYISEERGSPIVTSIIGTVFWGIGLALLLSNLDDSESTALASWICFAGLFIAPYFIVASLDMFFENTVSMVLIGIAKLTSTVLLYSDSLRPFEENNEFTWKFIGYISIISLFALLSFILIIMMPAVCSIKNWREESQKQKKIQKESKRKQIKEKYSYQLISAVEKNDAKMVASLLEKGADVNYKDFSVQTPLLIAVKNCDKIMISFLLEKGANIECIGENGKTPLLNAAQNGNIDIVSLLLEKGANINSIDSSCRTALDLAIENKDTDLVSLLLEKGAEIGNDNSSLKTALNFAIKNDNTDLLSLLAEKATQEDVYCEDKPILFFAIENNYKSFVEMLIEKGVHKKSRYSSDVYEDMTPLFFAVSRRDKDTVLLLLKNKVDVDEGAKSENQYYSYSPLYKAVLNGDKEIASILIENGANLNYDTGKGNTALMWTCLIEDKDMASFLIEKGADVNYVVSFTPSNEDKADLIKEGMDKKYLNYLSTGTATPLSRAIDSNKETMVSFLIEKGADVNLAVSINNEEYSYTMLQKAIYNGNKKIISLVLDAGAKINDNYQNRGTALITAIDTKFYDPEIVSLLIEREADVNLESAYDGHTPLTFAVTQNNKDAVLLLLKNGADPNKKSSKFGSPLMIAFQKVNKKMCSLLIENGANPDEVLCVAAAMPTTDVAQFFLDRGANVNCENSNGDTPLIAAICFRQKEMILFLISNGADVNFERSNSTETKIPRTPLESAINIGDAEIVSLLITYGADVNYKTKNGNTPLLFAALQGKLDLVPILKEAGAVSNPPRKNKTAPSSVPANQKSSDLTDDSAAFNSALVALSKIIAKNGTEIFSAENGKKLKALISDLVSQDNEVAEKLKQALSCDFVQIILDAADKSDGKKESAFKKAGDKIVGETKLEKETATSIVKLITLSLGWDLENLNLQ